MRPIVEAGETYALETDMDEEEARASGCPETARARVVAEIDGKVVGTAKGYANRAGNGAHVASGSFMVDQERSGQGIGRALGEDLIEWAREAGFKLIQFNAVVETNEGAVALMEVARIRDRRHGAAAFEHPSEGLVGLHVMYLEL